MNLFQKVLWTIVFELRRLKRHPRYVVRRIRDWQYFWKTYDNYVTNHDSNANIKLLPILGENTKSTPIEPIYFYQDAWAFERIIKGKPSLHIDVASHHKFVALLSKVTDLTMVDIRPLALSMESINFKEGSVLELPFEDGSLDSVSSLCVIEHIGLGRYGDPLDGIGTEKALEELKRVLAPEGNLYISLPVDDKNTVYFNAHRAFTEEKLMVMLKDFEILDRKYISGKQFVSDLPSGFCVGCYHLRKHKE